jgi:hypothetical protein
MSPANDVRLTMLLATATLWTLSLAIYRRKLDMDAPVFDDESLFIEHHGRDG